jgi:hypothetical protein
LFEVKLYIKRLFQEWEYTKPEYTQQWCINCCNNNLALPTRRKPDEEPTPITLDQYIKEYITDLVKEEMQNADR